MQLFKKLLGSKRSSEGRGSTAITKENLKRLQATLNAHDTNDTLHGKDDHQNRLTKRITKTFRGVKSKLRLKKNPRIIVEPPTRTTSSEPPPPAQPPPIPSFSALPSSTVNHRPRKVRFSSAASTVSTNATMSDLPGPGRAIGSLYSRGGRALERMLSNIAHNWGFGPHAAYLRMMGIVENACLDADDYGYGGDIGWGMSRSRGYLGQLGKSWDALVRYTWKGTLQTRVTALKSVIKLYLSWNTILYLDDYQPFGREFASCIRATRPAASKRVAYSADGSDDEDDCNDEEATNDEDFKALAEVVEISFGPKRRYLTECLNSIRDECDPMLSEDGNLIDREFDRKSATELLRPLFETIAKLSSHSYTEEQLWIQCRDWIVDQHVMCISQEYVTPRDLLDDVFSEYRVKRQAEIEHRLRKERKRRERFERAYLKSMRRSNARHS